MTEMTPWREQAIRLAVERGAWDDGYAEAGEALLVAVACAVLDLADAVRELGHQPDALAALTGAAPTADAVALLLRAHQQQPTNTTTKEHH